MTAILDLSNMAPQAGVQLGSRERLNYMTLAISGPNLVLLGRFKQLYDLAPMTNEDSTLLPHYTIHNSSILTQFESFLQNKSSFIYLKAT